MLEFLDRTGREAGPSLQLPGQLRLHNENQLSSYSISVKAAPKPYVKTRKAAE